MKHLLSLQKKEKQNIHQIESLWPNQVLFSIMVMTFPKHVNQLPTKNTSTILITKLYLVSAHVWRMYEGMSHYHHLTMAYWVMDECMDGRGCCQDYHQCQRVMFCQKNQQILKEQKTSYGTYEKDYQTLYGMCMLHLDV